MMNFLKKSLRNETIAPEKSATTQGETNQLTTIVVHEKIPVESLVGFMNLSVNFESAELSWRRNIVDQKVRLYGIEDLKGMNFEKAKAVLFEKPQYAFQLILAQWLNTNVRTAIKAGQESADITEIFNSDFDEYGEEFSHEEIREKLMSVFEVLEDTEDELKVRLISHLNS